MAFGTFGNYYTPGGYYPAQYQPPYYQPGQLQQPTPPAQTQQSSAAMIWVQGEQAARDYPVAPNSAVSLWDNSAPVVYLKQADASGKTTLKIYDMVERAQSATQTVKPAPVDYVTHSELNGITARLEALESKQERTRTVRAKREEREGDD